MHKQMELVIHNHNKINKINSISIGVLNPASKSKNQHCIAVSTLKTAFLQQAFVIIKQVSYMHQDENKHRITRKPLHKKYINSRIIPRTKANTSFSASEDREDKRKDEVERNITMKINEQSISFIAKKLEISFISNGQDRSLDSFDKMIIGVDEELDLQDNTEGQEPDFTFLYKEFQRLCKEQNKPKEHSDSNIEDLLLGGEEEKPPKQQSGWQESQQSPLGAIVRQRLEQIKNLRQKNMANMTGSDPNISIRLLGANLSEIHEEEIQHNSSLHPMDPIDQEFIDFVGKGQGPSKINISKIQESQVQKEEQKKATLKNDVMKQAEEDEVVAMLENELVSRGYQQQESLNEEQISLNKKPKKQSFSKESYKPILYELQQNEQKKGQNGEGGVATLLSRRYQWIKSRTDKSKKWKMREMKLIDKFRQILQNAQAEFSDQDEHSGET